jgi:hypothetical protein
MVVEASHAKIGDLRRAIATETLVALGLPRSGLLQTLLRPLVWPPTQRFARLAAEFDSRVALDGLPQASDWALSLFIEGHNVFGEDRVPRSGPLVVISNHPGSYDVLLIAAALGRDDLKIPASDVPFLRKLVATASHLIYTDTGPNAHARMAAARQSIRHLKEGGALLLFASAQVDPDPAFLPGARNELQKWSPSLALFLRQVPETVSVVTIVSGVLSPSCFRHPLTRLRKEQRLKQFLAEFLQVSQQVLFGRRFGLVPSIRFAEPLVAAQLGVGRDPQLAKAILFERAEGLLAEAQGSGPYHRP